MKLDAKAASRYRKQHQKNEHGTKFCCRRMTRILCAALLFRHINTQKAKIGSIHTNPQPVL